MVLINLTKLVSLIHAIKACPVTVPFRNEKLFESYQSFRSNSNDVVSISVMASLEGIKERRLDDEDVRRRRLIVIELINQFTSSKIQFNYLPCTSYLISDLTVCDVCKEGLLYVYKPRLAGRKATLYTRNGARSIEVYSKQCSNLSCMATVYATYTEYKKVGDLIRKYTYSSDRKVFSITQETFFEVELLDEVSEDIFTCKSRFVNIARKYNNLHKGIPLVYKRLDGAWLLYMIYKKLEGLEFLVERKNDRNIAVDSICARIFPRLKQKIDREWLHHTCKGCSGKTVIMDGAAKAYRTCCAYRGEKLVNHGELNEFTACSNSPERKENFCDLHLKDENATPVEVENQGMLTRSKRKELGLDDYVLTSDNGCRKRENINIRTTRAKTAGMLFCYRPCGVSLGFLELIHAECCTHFMLLLIEIFGTRPSPDMLKGVAIGRSL